MATLSLLADINRGMRDYPELIRTHFQMESEALERQLYGYTQLENFLGIRAPMPRGWPLKGIPSARVSDEAMVPVLAEARVRLSRSFDSTAESAGGMTDDQQVYLSGLGRWLSDDRVGAIEAWSELSPVYPKSALVIRAPAQHFIDAWLADPDWDLTLSDDDSANFRSLLNDALEQDPSDQTTMMYLAWLEALSTQPVVENINLVQRSVGGMIQPGLTLLAIAKLRWQMGDESTARTLVYEYHDREHWPWVELVDLMETKIDLWAHVPQ